MAEALIKFNEGDDILASEINANYEFLENDIGTKAEALKGVLNGKMATLEATVSSAQATLQNNINELEASLKTIIQEMYRPDFTRVKSFSSQTYTAPYDGVYYCSFAYNKAAPAYCYVNNVQVAAYWDYEGSGGLVTTTFSIVVNKGDVIKWSKDGVRNGRFVPYKGSK